MFVNITDLQVRIKLQACTEKEKENRATINLSNGKNVKLMRTIDLSNINNSYGGRVFGA